MVLFRWSSPTQQAMLLLFVTVVMNGSTSRALAFTASSSSLTRTTTATFQSTLRSFSTIPCRKCQPMHRPLSLFRVPSASTTSPGSTETLPSAVAVASNQQRRRPLFQSPQQPHDNSINQSNNNKSLLRRLSSWWMTCQKSLRHGMVLIMASLLFWTSTAALHAPPAMASSVPSFIERIMPYSSHEPIVNKYIQQHMFDVDDSASTDPLESAYREAFSDYKTDGSYPRALKEVTADVLGKKMDVGRKANEGHGGFLGALQGAIKLVERGTGVSEATALKIVGGTLVVTIPTTLLLFALSVAQQSKRSMNRLMKERYGASYTVDATIREEPDEVAPDEDEDDDDDDDDDKDTKK